jgi:hypothetical protein
LDIDAHQARDRAEAIFKKKQERLLDGQKATAEYEATRLATREKTARLRALRLARDVARKTPRSNRRDCSRVDMVQIRREARRGLSNEKRQDHLGKVHHGG